MLWGELTAAEHVRLVARLKGLAEEEVEAEVEASLKAVDLWVPKKGKGGGGSDNGSNKSTIKKNCDDAGDAIAARHGGEMQVRMFSGGMKRRLSVATACVGSPRVIFLDEPTTGNASYSSLSCRITFCLV
jgi:ABC-type multidrug transport system ATPase subunit